MIRIAVFASGNGTNAQNIITFFNNSSIARVVLVLSNNKGAKVLERANRLKVSTLHFDKYDLFEAKSVGILLKDQVDFIVLAGFLWRIPIDIIRDFPKKIINIHPALLPKYGGKGMYGMRVHKAVKENNEKKTGISIHYVNKEYDKGNLIFQKSFNIPIGDSSEDIAKKIHQLEYAYFPKVIAETIALQFLKEHNKL